eukprot:Skav203176  [mRNA]  locus=scaffold39:103479:107678:- [translate_table: standard]
MDHPLGQSFSLVAQVLRMEAEVLHCIGISPKQFFSVHGAPSLQPGLYTFYDLQRLDAVSQDCMFGNQTVAMPHAPKGEFSNMKIVDVCSGMGGFSIGSRILGMKTLAFVNHSKLACDALRANFDSPVFQSDIGDIETIKAIHALKDAEYLQLTGGFPCQGFSRQGDQQGMLDDRSSALPLLLRAAWLLQVDELLLECVAQVIHFPQAQACLDRFAALTGKHIARLTFDLKDQWPSKRHRFWCRISPSELPCIAIPPWSPNPKYQCLAAVMPVDALWDDWEEDELQWDSDEMTVYFDSAFGHDQRVLTAQDQAPTALHSWGHVTRPCPCGCRLAFSTHRLRSGGARGFGLRSSRDGRVRHFHPQEAAAVCTVPPSYRFPMSLRAALTLLGQIAAPMQVLWVQSHILASLQSHFFGQTYLDPEDAIGILQTEIKSFAHAYWVTPLHHQPRVIYLALEDEPNLIEVHLNAPTRVAHLIKAEKDMAGWGSYVMVSHEGHRMDCMELLEAGQTYVIHRRQRCQARPFPATSSLSAGGTGDSTLWLGDKIIWDYMRAMVSQASLDDVGPAPFLMHPFRLSQLLETEIPNLVALDWQRRYSLSTGDIHVIGELQGHWIYLHGRWSSLFDGLRWTCYDGLRMTGLRPWIQQATEKITDMLHLNHLGLSEGWGIDQLSPNTCGTVALLHLAQVLGLLPWVAATEVDDVHEWLLHRQQTDALIRAGGPGDWQQQLVSLLQEKGVPAAEATNRAQQVIKKLGTQQVQGLMQSKHPWNSLKAAASKPGTMFRLLTHDEQQAFIADRAKTKHGAKINNHKAKKSTKGFSNRPLRLDPDQFEINPSHFKDEDEDPVNQIHFDEVVAEARGVALCTTDMAKRFLDAPDSISVDALALLILTQPDDELFPNASLEKLVIPAKFKGTDEHILIHGVILQLGDVTVSRAHASTNSSPEVITTQVLKIQVFRDQLSCPWDRFVAAPIRTLLSSMEAFQLCKGRSCGAACPKYHPAVDETIDHVIFEIWARNFLDEQGKRTDGDRAVLFTAFVRVPAGAVDKLLINSPTGVYIEPRSDKPREYDDRYRVVWLPGASADEAMHQCKTYEKAMCLVRLRNKYGVRVKKEDEKAAWAHLRPGMDFIALQVQQIYELFPIPHGTQRQAIVQLLRDWSWPARPLQPGRGSATHMSWRVGAQSAPPSPVMTGFKNDIIITQVKELKPPEPKPTLIASRKTQRHLRQAPKVRPTSSTSGDPWQDDGKDPWAGFVRTTPPAAGEGKSRLNEIQAQLRSEVATEVTARLGNQATEAIQAAAANTANAAGHQDQRLQALEVGLTELREQNGQLATWCKQTTERISQNENTMSAVQHTLDTHQHELHALGQNFQSTMSSVKRDLSSELNSNFEKQMSRMEALLEKRNKTS